MGYKAANEAVLSRRATQRDGRLTIGLIMSNISRSWEEPQWWGVSDAARELEVNLICFLGRELRSPQGYDAQGNVLYDLISAEQLDGLVLWSAGFDNFLSPAERVEFCARYRPLPIVSVENAIEGIPSVLMDSYQSMCELLVHLLDAHGYRRIAYLAPVTQSHFGVQERYRAYTETLTKYGVFDPALTYSGTQGREALAQRLQNGRMDIDAIVGHADEAALFALRTVQSLGLRVPKDIAVVGFNDIAESQVVMPPLTTVQPPFYDMGRKAVETLLALIEDEHVPEQTRVPSRLIVRRSCGCPDRETLQAAVDSVPVARQMPDISLATRREEILRDAIRAVRDSSQTQATSWARQLLDSFVTELDGKAPGGFLQELERLLQEITATGGDAAAWQGVVSALRRQVIPYLAGDVLLLAENLFQQARVAISQTAQRLAAYSAIQAEQQTRTLREISQVLITKLDTEELMTALAERLPDVRIPSCYLSLYEDPQKPAEWSRLILASNEHRRTQLEPDGRRFPSRQLVPEEMLPRERRYTYVIEPLYFREQQLGFVLFEAGPREGQTYDALHGQISSALQGALLVQRVQERSAELARQQYVLDTFMDTVPDRIYFKNLEGRITRANRAHARRFGLSDPAQEIGKTDFDFFTPEEAQSKYEQEQNIIRTGQPLADIEEKHTSRDGRVDWALTTKMPLRDEKDNIIGTFGISRDITEIKRAQQAQEWRARELQAAAEVSRAASSILDTNQLIQQTVNLIRDRFGLYYVGLFLLDQEKRYAVLQAGTGEAGRQMLAQGHKLEVGGASMIGWCIANRQARIALDVGKDAVRFDNPFLPETRSELALPLISRGRVIGAMTVQSDRAAAFEPDNITILQTMADQLANATENAQLFGALTREQYLMEALMDNVPDYIYFKDIHSRFISTSKALAQSFGLSDPAQMMGKTDFDFFTEEHARPAYEDEQRIIQTGQPLMNIEEKETRPERPDAWVLTTKLPLHDKEGKIVGTFGISTDITERKLSETKIQETLRELEHLYRITSRQGWQALRETTQLMPGYLFDRATLQPRPDLWMPQIEQAVEHNTFVPPTDEQAVAVAPLSVRGEVVGAVGVYDNPQRPLSAEELELVQQIAEQGALALESARLFEQTQASLAEARALYHFSEVTSRETDLQAVYDAVSRMLVEEWGYASTWISVLDEDGRMLTGVAGAGADMTEETIRATLSVSEARLPATLAVQERKAMVVNDPLNDKRLADLPSTIRASLGKTIATPVTAGDELKGIIVATRSQASTDISERDERLLQAVASQVAIAIQRAQLLEQTRAALDEVEATHRRYLREQWETYLAAVLDRSTGFMDSSAGLMPASDVWLPEMEQALERDETIVASTSNNQDQHAALAVPLKLRGAPIGVLEFYEQDQPHEWSDDERALVQALADQAVLALENARLFEETQARAQREQLINAITARIRASMDMETILKTTAQELSKTLNLSRARIRLRAGDGDKAND